MHGEFCVDHCYDAIGLGQLITGQVTEGEIVEGAIGRTSKGERFTVVKIEQHGDRKRSALKKDKVNLYVKYVNKSKVRKGDIMHFD
ncbi:MAG: hypothetical protein PHV17_06565 [Candidatus Omnitrophica bacterium]|nr:hypothetical protein [Candidatus Omnitrophota bacterium]